MGEWYKNANDLILLFTFDDEADTERYITSWKSMYIDKTTGKLIYKHIVNSDPFSARSATISVYDYEASYEYLKKIIACDSSLSAKFGSLNEDNWEEWLKENI